MKNHRKEEHDESLYNRRIKQNLVAINFDDDSDDDLEWSPSLHDEEVLEENVIESSNSKRKRKTTTNSEPVKKTKPDHNCPNCGKSFSRKDSLQRHLTNICNK